MCTERGAMRARRVPRFARLPHGAPPYGCTMGREAGPGSGSRGGERHLFANARATLRSRASSGLLVRGIGRKNCLDCRAEGLAKHIEDVGDSRCGDQALDITLDGPAQRPLRIREERLPLLQDVQNHVRVDQDSHCRANRFSRMASSSMDESAEAIPARLSNTANI